MLRLMHHTQSFQERPDTMEYINNTTESSKYIHLSFAERLCQPFCANR